MRSNMGLCGSDAVGCDRDKLWTPGTGVHPNRGILVQPEILNSADRSPPWPKEDDTRDRWNRLSDVATTHSFRPIGQIRRDLLYGKKITPKTRLRPEVNALPDFRSLAQMNGDSMHTISRGNLSSENIGEPYFYIQACTPNFQVVSAVNNLISDTEKPRPLQEIDPEPHQNANRDYMYDGLVENASVNKRWRGDGRNKCDRTQPKAAFVQSRVFE
jgi:hypothetical protein